MIILIGLLFWFLDIELFLHRFIDKLDPCSTIILSVGFLVPDFAFKDLKSLSKFLLNLYRDFVVMNLARLFSFRQFFWRPSILSSNSKNTYCKCIINGSIPIEVLILFEIYLIFVILHYQAVEFFISNQTKYSFYDSLFQGSVFLNFINPIKIPATIFSLGVF